MKIQLLKRISTFLLAGLASGCASYGVIVNEPKSADSSKEPYSLATLYEKDRNRDLRLSLSFSGGGTRAAALAYGVMQELRDTTIMVNGQEARLLDQVDTISSVSGGSFTSAYYGLHGDGLFDTFEEVFLRYDVEGHLVRSVLNPFHWFGPKGRTQRAIEYYQKQVFNGATFADMMQPGRPLIVINASDLGEGVRFSFVQDYFDLLCSDISTFPVANAVTASSAVPAVFNPVVVENYSDCEGYETDWVKRLSQRADTTDDAEVRLLADGLESYSEKQRRKYIHFVDGGITDNIGLRAIYDTVTAAGDPNLLLKKFNAKPASKFVLIAVNASTAPVYDMDNSKKQPSIADTIGAVSGVQLHRYNASTLELLQDSMTEWASQLSTEDHEVRPYFITVSIDAIKEPSILDFFNKIPTSFSLTDEQVDRLIQVGRELLRRNPQFQQLVADLGGQIN